MTNGNSAEWQRFEYARSLLPNEMYWGEPITVAAVLHIADAALSVCADGGKDLSVGWRMEVYAAPTPERADAEKDAALTDEQIDVLITEHSEWTPQGYAIVDSHCKAFARAILSVIR